MFDIEEQFQATVDVSEYDNTIAVLLLFIYGTVLAGVVLRYILEAFHIPVPFQIFILLIGIVIGFLGQYFKIFSKELHDVIVGRNEYLLIIALPVLVFKLCICMDGHSFKQNVLQVLTISIPCTLINGLVIGFIMKLVENSTYWSFQFGIMYGFTCASIHPEETLVYLKELGLKGKHLSILLEGEAIVGTVTSIVMMIASLKHYIGYLHTPMQITEFIFRYIIGGIIVGCISGFFLNRLMKLFYNDVINIIIVSISAPFMVYYISLYILRVGGILCLVIVGISMSFQRTELSTEIDSSLIYFWELVSLVMTCIVFALNGLVFGMELLKDIEASDFAKIGIAYMVIYSTRFATFFLFSPIIGRMQNEISFRHMIVAAWGGVRGSVTLCLVMISYQEEETLAFFKDIVFVHMTGIVFLSLLVNVPTIPSLLSCLGISVLSLARVHNMNTCVNYVMNKRDRMIALLKMDRFLADANWSLVNSLTVMKHPYKDIKGVDAEQHYSGRGSICPDCHKEVSNQPTPKEIEEMRREARMRILKAKKVSYAKQHENGLLSKEAFIHLTEAVEKAQNIEGNYLKIEILLKLFRKKLFLQRLRTSLCRYFQDKIYNRVPRISGSRRKCFYRTVYHPAYEAGHFLLAISSFASSVYEVTLNDYSTQNLEMKVIKAFNMAFFIYFFCDMLMKICACSSINIIPKGMKNFLRQPWNRIDLFLFFILAADLTMDILDIIGMLKKYASLKNKTTIFLKLSRIIVLFKIMTLLNVICPVVIRLCDKIVDKRMSTIYDIGKGFVKGEEEVLELLDQMIPNKLVRQEMRSVLENDKLLVTKELGLIQKEKPWIAITVKTKQAITTILHHMELSMEDLKSSGWIDHLEYKKLSECFNEKRKMVHKMKTINSCPPKVIFQEVIWLNDDTKIVDFLFNRVTARVYEPGEVVCQYGEVPPGVFILITGLFKSSYRPTPKTLDILQKHGVLPVFDYISSSRFEKNIDEYIVSGNTVGELSYLTERPYNATVTADTPCQVFILSKELLKEASELVPDKVNGLESRMWKFTTMKLALSILSKCPAYNTATEEKLRYALEKSFIPDLMNSKIFVNNTMIEDIILIEGVVADSYSKENYTAPCYIPRTILKLTLVDESVNEMGIIVRPKLMVIPTKDAEPEDVMEAAEEMGEFYQKTDMIQYNFLNNPSSKLYRRKRRVRNSLVGSTKSSKYDMSDTSWSKSNVSFRFNTQEAQNTEPSRQRVLPKQSFESISLSFTPNQMQNALNESEEIENTDQGETRNSKPLRKMNLKQARPTVINIPSSGETNSQEGDEVNDSALRTPHPFSAEEDTANSLSDKENQQPRKQT